MLGILNDNDKRQKIGEGIYLLYFAVMMGARAAGLYEGMTIYNITLVIGLLLFGCKMLVTKHGIKEYAVAATFLLVAGIVYIHTGEKGLLVCFTMMLGMKGVSTVKVIKTGFLVAGVIILFKIFTGVFGILPEIYYTQDREGVGLTFRHALGYAHPNTLHMNVLMLTMLGMYLVTKSLAKERSADMAEHDREAIGKLTLFSVCAFLFNLYVFQYSYSRTGLLACIVFLVVNFWFFIVEKPRMLEKVICYISFPVVCFIAIVGPFILPDSVFSKIDQTIFTTRFSIARYFWEYNSISLFGIRLNNPINMYTTYGLDMAQLYLFLQLGIVAFVVISALTMWFIYYSLKMNHMQELAVLMGMLCLGIWEPLLYNLGFKNFVYVFMGAAIYSVIAADEASAAEDKGLPLKNLGTVWLSNCSLASLLKALAGGLLAGGCAMLLFIVVTNSPSNYYGSRELSESGKSLGMEAVYFSADQITQMEASGDIIVGYVDEVTPMYEFGSEIATSEYRKRAISVALFTTIIVCIIYLAFENRKMCYNRK